MSTDPVMVTASSAAHRLGRSVETIRRWCRDGVFPGAEHNGFGGVWMIPAGVIEGYIRRRREAVTEMTDTPASVTEEGDYSMSDADTKTAEQLRRELAAANARIEQLENVLERRSPTPDDATLEAAAKKRARGEYGL